MDAALASAVLKVAGEKLVSLISSEFASITGVKKDLRELQGKQLEISTWLADIATGSGTALPRVKELRNVAYDIEDILYEVQIESEKHKIHSEGDKQQVADCFCAKPKSFLFRCKVAHKIKEINVKYDRIVKQAGDANAIRNNLEIHHPVWSSNRTAGELSMQCNVEDSKIPTRDQMKDKIISKILEPNAEEYGRPMIVSIIGLGGSGKTTLAKVICDDKKIKEHFHDTIFWVHVSEEFDIKKLIGKLFQTITGKKYDAHAEEHRLKEISKQIGTNKYLLVLDDAWHNKRDGGWEIFMVHLKNSAPRSKIMLTTRDRKVAELVGSREEYNLQSLSEAETWNLFLKSSEWAEEDLGGEYIQVGKEILKKCGGLPLAIKTLGGILRENKEISIWRGIRDSDLWTDESIKDSVYASLKLSFIHLADELKQCFTFFSIFPKGFEIHKDRLIAQWLAHGFINSMNGVEPEDIGCSYFDSLVKVGFLHDPNKDWQSTQLTWKMHDLIHDLAREIMDDEVVTPNNNMTTNATHRSRYLSLTSCTEKVDRGLLDKVHALYICGGNPSFNKLVKKSCFVHSVTLHYTMNAPFPHFILKFEYVGYLEIRNLQSIVLLPEAISGCWNLQALIFIDCSGFVTLPESIGKLKKLRTLELREIKDLESLPLSLGDCRDLQYLKLYSCWRLRKIPISLDRNESLKLLQIVNCLDLKQLPSEFDGEFSNLQTFSLASCSSFRHLPAATLSCPMLCTIDLSRTQVTMLPQWVTTISTLQCINLQFCRHLVELPKGIGKLKSLAVLNVEGCKKLPCMPSGIGQLTRLTQLGLFVVGCGRDDARISELENLNTLSDDLRITNLMYLKDPCDAKKACLKQKNGIQNLVLNWSPIDTEEEMEQGTGQDLSALNDLEPPSDVKELEIECYRGPSLPRWAMKQNEDSSYCEGITLKQMGSCQFPFLTELTLCQCPNLKHMRGLLVFPSLKSLFLVKMDQLQELWTTTTSEIEISEEKLRAQYCFPVLSILEIQECPKLSSVKPYFPTSLERLYLNNMDWQILSLGNFSHLLSPPDNEYSSSCSCIRQSLISEN
ncbi:unnamed protein product [Urochloa decumbens]|uniref:Uncharacterized protein n=1 Tax=Urochloa decumbens TaxID=240449 RepID=A0ABC9AWW4_9POAL